MAEKLYPLQSVELKGANVNAKAYDYGQALECKYKGWNSGSSIAYGVTMGMMGSLIVGFGASLFVSAPGAATGVIVAFGVLLAGAVSAFHSVWRGRGIKRLRRDPEAKYLYRLKQAVDAYNKQAAAYNQYLPVGQENMNIITESVLCRFQEALRPVGENLQKQISGAPDTEEIPHLSMKEIDQTRLELERCGSEAQLALPASSPEPLAPPPVPRLIPQSSESEAEELSDYMRALAELDAEFPVND